MNQESNQACAAWLKSHKIHLILVIVKALDASDGAPHIPAPARYMIAHQNLTALITRLENNRFEAMEFQADFVAALKRGATVSNVAYITETIVQSLTTAVEADKNLSPELKNTLKAKLSYFDTLLKTALASAIVLRQGPRA